MDKRPSGSLGFGTRVSGWLNGRWVMFTEFITYLGGPKTLAGADTPILIGGTGGSGTRVVTAQLQSAGYFAGTHLNRSIDSWDMDRFCNTWLRRYLADGPESLTAGEKKAMNRHLNHAFVRHRSGIDVRDGPWVMKHPRTLLLLPYLDAQLNGMKFIHVVRDGRDMALSRNTHQADLYGDLILSDDAADAPLPEKLTRFWALTNLEAKRFGEAAMGERYLRVRLEDLCANPEVQTRRLFDWLGVAQCKVGPAAALVRTPGSLGRWRHTPSAGPCRISTTVVDALDAFGYSGSASAVGGE